MQERRRAKRINRRLAVRFGERDLDRAGYTQDISSQGLFILSDGSIPRGARIHVQLFLDKDHFLLMEGIIVRDRKVAPELRRMASAGFGVRLLSPAELLLGVAPEQTPPVQNQFAVEYGSEEELRRAFSGELRMGGVFVPTHRTLSAGTEVVIDVRLTFAKKSMQFAARVLQATDPSAGGTQGIAFLFVDRDKVIAELGAALAPGG